MIYLLNAALSFILPTEIFIAVLLIFTFSFVAEPWQNWPLMLLLMFSLCAKKIERHSLRVVLIGVSRRTHGFLWFNPVLFLGSLQDLSDVTAYYCHQCQWIKGGWS